MSLLCRCTVYKTMDEAFKWYSLRSTHTLNIREYKQYKECLLVTVYDIGRANTPRIFPKDLALPEPILILMSDYNKLHVVLSLSLMSPLCIANVERVAYNNGQCP